LDLKAIALGWELADAGLFFHFLLSTYCLTYSFQRVVIVVVFVSAA